MLFMSFVRVVILTVTMWFARGSHPSSLTCQPSSICWTTGKRSFSAFHFSFHKNVCKVMCYGVKIYLCVHYVQAVQLCLVYEFLSLTVSLILVVRVHVLVLFESVFTSEQFFEKELKQFRLWRYMFKIMHHKNVKLLTQAVATRLFSCYGTAMGVLP